MGDASKRAKRVLLCACGGFQVYGLPGFVLALLKHVTDDVQVVLSRAAARLTSPYAVEVASRHKVYIELDDHGPEAWVPHIELSRQADLVLVYPATVNVIGKVAGGIADELIPAIVLASEAPVFFVPITNPKMWGHSAVQRNVTFLRESGHAVLAPLPNIEIATREGLEAADEPFPYPTLLAQMRSAIRARD
ncbi:MAG: flavoprotein [Thermoanaerobaculia bacterium]